MWSSLSRTRTFGFACTAQSDPPASGFAEPGPPTG